VLRLRFPATLAIQPVKPDISASKATHKKSRSVETEQLRWLFSRGGLRRPD
jgi:hypothetical protein